MRACTQVVEILCRDPPYKSLQLAKPWEGGALSYDAVVEKLRGLLPPTFEVR